MKHKVLPIIGAVALLLGASATPVAAMTGPILPGRPISTDGHTGNGCRAWAYGRVNGAMVLFVADHCFATQQEGAAVYDMGANPDQFIGYMGKRSNLWGGNDVAYIVLDSTRIPSSGRNRIYRGDVTNNGLTSDDYWYVTHQPDWGCSEPYLNTHYYDVVYVPFQSSQSTTTDYRYGRMLGHTSNGNDGCLVATDLQSRLSQGVCCDAGSAFVPSWDTGTVWGVATDAPNNKLRFNSVKEGLDDLNAYMLDHGGSGARLCTTSAC